MLPIQFKGNVIKHVIDMTFYSLKIDIQSNL